MKTLSNHIVDWIDDIKRKRHTLEVEYVKEFIRNLADWKEIMKTWHIPLPTIELLCLEFDRFIKKKAGENLTK